MFLEPESSCNKLLNNKDITAIVTTDDLLAFGVIKELNNREVKNIAVVGFNNTQLAQYQNPPLASVHINADKLGYQATKLLIERLEKTLDYENKHYIVNTEFIERQSFISNE